MRHILTHDSHATRIFGTSLARVDTDGPLAFETRKGKNVSRARGLSAKLYRLRRFPADLNTVSKRRSMTP